MDRQTTHVFETCTAVAAAAGFTALIAAHASVQAAARTEAESIYCRLLEPGEAHLTAVAGRDGQIDVAWNRPHHPSHPTRAIREAPDMRFVSFLTSHSPDYPALFTRTDRLPSFRQSTNIDFATEKD